MPVYVVDAVAALTLAEAGWSDDDVELFAPTLLRSQVLSLARASVLAGTREPDAALELAETASRLPRRLLGDAVMRATAWRIATEQGWPDTTVAEYVALTRLQGDGLVAGDDQVRRLASPLVPTCDAASFLTGTRPKA